MRLVDLPTPCLLLDRERLRANLRRAAGAAARAGLPWRIGAGEARSADVMRLALEAAAEAGAAPGGIAVSTLAEAEYFAAHDLTGILYLQPVTPGKLDQVAALDAAGAELLAVTADAEAAAAIAVHPAAPRVLIALAAADASGLHPGDPALPDAACRLGALFAGLLARPGIGADGVRQAMRALADRRHQPQIVCVSPDCLGLEAATELLDGGDMLGGGALTVLASVTGRRAPGQLALDAGAVALGNAGGTLLDADGADLSAGAGVLPVAAELSAAAARGPHLPAVGTRLRVLPRAPGLAAAAHDRFFVIEGGEVAAVWPRVAGW